MYIDRNSDKLKYFEDGTIAGSVPQKSYTESFVGLHYLDWLTMGLAEQCITGAMQVAPENYKRFLS